MYKQENQLCPQPLKRDIPLNSDFHSYNTRHRNDPCKPKVRTKLFTDSFYNRTIAYCSVIPDEAKNCLNITSFVSCLRKHLLNEWFYIVILCILYLHYY